MFDLTNEADRKQFTKEVETKENRFRKADSLKALEVYSDRMEQYVRDYLMSQYSQKTVLEMPIISTVNLCRRIAIKEASMYKVGPERTFTNISEDQQNEIKALYKDSDIDATLFKANVFYKIQGQTFLQVIPKNGDLSVRAMMPHHLDVVPDPLDPEVAQSYVVNSFDKTQFIKSDYLNQNIADKDDYRSTLRRFVAWTADANFIFNGKGELITPIDINPIGELPFIDISGDKDFEFFVRIGQALVDFTIQYNGALSDLAQIVKMQAWAVAYLKGPKELIPESLSIGPNKILHLPTDSMNPDVKVEFGFASPNPDVGGSIQHVEMLLSNFLTSRGLDPNIVNGKAQVIKYNSGIDRLLGMVEALEASKQDMETFACVEDELFELVKKWSQATFGTDQQFMSFAIPEDCEINVAYHKPEMVESQTDALANIQLKLELGLMTKQMAIEELYDMDADSAEELLIKIQEDQQMSEPQEIEQRPAGVDLPEGPLSTLTGKQGEAPTPGEFNQGNGTGTNG